MENKRVHIHSNAQVGFRGEFRYRLYNSDGSIAAQSDWSSNQIQNWLIDTGMNNFPWSNYAVLGNSGAGLPPVTTSTLPNVLAPNDGGVVTANGPTPVGPAYGRNQIKTFTYNAGTATGTITQVGICANSDGTGLAAVHVLDAPINKAAEQILKLDYRFWVYPTLGSTTVNLQIGAYNYDCVTSFYNLLDVGSNCFSQADIFNGNSAYHGTYSNGAVGPEVSDLTVYIGGTQTIGDDGSGPGYKDYSVTYSINQANSLLRTFKSIINPGSLYVQTEVTATSGPGIGAGFPKEYTHELVLHRRMTWTRYVP